MEAGPSRPSSRSRRQGATPKTREDNAGDDVGVLDSSAVLALLLGESGADDVAQTIAHGAAISTVNLSEVADVLLRNKFDADSMIARLSDQVAVEPFTHEDALAAAAMSPPTRRQGLSLGDRACLALAHRLDATALTADREWSRLKLGVSIRLLR